MVSPNRGTQLLEQTGRQQKSLNTTFNIKCIGNSPIVPRTDSWNVQPLPKTLALIQASFSCRYVLKSWMLTYRFSFETGSARNSRSSGSRLENAFNIGRLTHSTSILIVFRKQRNVESSCEEVSSLLGCRRSRSATLLCASRCSLTEESNAEGDRWGGRGNRER